MKTESIIEKISQLIIEGIVVATIIGIIGYVTNAFDDVLPDLPKYYKEITKPITSIPDPDVFIMIILLLVAFVGSIGIYYYKNND